MGLIEIGDGQLPMKDFLSIKKNEFIKEDKKEVFFLKKLKKHQILQKDQQLQRKS